MRRRDSAASARSSMPMAWACIALLAVAVALGGCESNSVPPGPYDVVSNYLSDIGEGNYSGACGLLDGATRQALLHRMGSRTTCARVFVRCLPSDALNLSRDQSQLLYANYEVVEHRRKASVTVGGTAVAKAIRQVSLAKERGTWKLTSYGEALESCSGTQHRLRAARRSPRAAVG